MVSTTPPLAAATQICHGWMPSLELAGEVYLVVVVVVVVAVVVVATGPLFTTTGEMPRIVYSPMVGSVSFLSPKSESKRASMISYELGSVGVVTSTTPEISATMLPSLYPTTPKSLTGNGAFTHSSTSGVTSDSFSRLKSPSSVIENSAV